MDLCALGAWPDLSTDVGGHLPLRERVAHAWEMPSVSIPRGPFTTREAYAAGVTHRVLEGPTVRRVFTGVFVAANVEITLAVRVASALKVLPRGAVATSVTALRLHGVEVGPVEPLRFCTTHSRQVRRPGIAVARVSTAPESRGTIVSPQHAFASAAQHLNLLELVVAGDWLLRLRRCSLASLTSYAAAYEGRGAVFARRASGLVQFRADSPRETRLRLVLVLSGLPTPDCNPRLGNAEGPIGWVDLVYQQFKVIIEYEGDQHRTDTRQWNIDIDRSEAFTPVPTRASTPSGAPSSRGDPRVRTDPRRLAGLR